MRKIATMLLNGKESAKKKEHIRMLAEIEPSVRCVIQNMYLADLYVLRCYMGKFRIEFDEGMRKLELGAGEVLIIYPEHRVSIWTLEEKNRMVYASFAGEDCVSYFNELGFFDLAHGSTMPQYQNVCELRRRLENRAGESDGMADEHYVYVTNILRTIAHDMCSGGNRLVFDAIRQIRRNLEKQVVRLEPLCCELGVSRSCLHRAFTTAGLGAPAEYIRREQLQMALSLLKTTRLPIVEVAQKAGFISAAHFSSFIKEHTGVSPREFRLGRGGSGRYKAAQKGCCGISENNEIEKTGTDEKECDK